VRAAVEGFLGGEERHEELIRQLLMIVVWHKACLEN
jgi:hypothetical protein